MFTLDLLIVRKLNLRIATVWGGFVPQCRNKSGIASKRIKHKLTSAQLSLVLSAMEFTLSSQGLSSSLNPRRLVLTHGRFIALFVNR
jgi:hypothetical protein